MPCRGRPVSLSPGETGSGISIVSSSKIFSYAGQRIALAIIPPGLMEKFMALSNHLFVLAKQNQFVEESMVFATAVVLIGLVLMVNSLAIIFRIYLRSRKKW